MTFVEKAKAPVTPSGPGQGGIATGRVTFRRCSGVNEPVGALGIAAVISSPESAAPVEQLSLLSDKED